MANNEIYPTTIPDCFARSHFWSFDCQKCRFSDLCMKKKIESDFLGKEYWLYKRARAKK